MTMRITVTNTDTSRACRVTTQEINAETKEKKANPSVEIAPGETKEFWIYQARDALVEEV